MPNPTVERAPKRRSRRRSLAALVGGTAALMLSLTPFPFGSSPASRTPGATARELLRNGGFEELQEPVAIAWGSTGSGYRVARGEGRDGSHAVICAAKDRSETLGACQTLTLDRSTVLPLRVSGWSKAHEVDGASDDHYSIYASVEYQDGSRLDKVAVDFDVGTHDWQRRELLIPAVKPVRTLILHALFRGHGGTAWFDDFSVEELQPDAGTILFQGAPWTPPTVRTRGAAPPRTFETRNGLRLTVRRDRIESILVHGREKATLDPSGFAVRDAARGSPWIPVDDSGSRELGLAVDARWEAATDHLLIDGEVRDLTRKDRAVSLSFLVPVDALGWSWGEDPRRSRTIGGAGEYVESVPVPCGSTGTLSRYPVAAVYSLDAGLAVASDPESAVQYRVGYHAELRKLFISFDFGLLPDSVDLPSRARFRFAIFAFDPAEGFRGALAGLYSIFPERFARRCLDAGGWLPFTSPSQIPRWEDFGFAFREVARGEPLDGVETLRTFRYTEPLGWWTPLPEQIPRSRDALLARLGDLDAGALPLEAVERSAMKTAAGLPRFTFEKRPWCDGVLWSMNPNPRLPGASTAARLWWNAEIRARDYLQESVAGAGGEFIDSAEGYAMAELDFDREHLRYSSVPPSFSSDSRVPVLFKGQMIHEYVKAAARDLRELGKFSFGNGTPHRFSFLAPSFDILGTEVDWFPDGRFAPATDADLLFRRAMAYQKPTCVLLNTALTALTPENLDLYFQRCLFYGMFPGLFSHDAHTSSYWTNAALYERDRPLFRRYMPLIRRTAIAGWQPVTRVRSDRPEVLTERFGPDGAGIHFVTVLNTAQTDQEAELALDFLAGRGAGAKDLIGDVPVPLRDGRIRITLPAQSVRLLEVRELPQK
jgi:hypothetical protein